MSCWIPECGIQPVVQWGRRLPKSTDIGPVFACGDHAITLDAAARTHQPECAPVLKNLPSCGCTPEPLPAPDELPETVRLSTGWVIHARRHPPGEDPGQPSSPLPGRGQGKETR